jgi:hypothetical protein
MGRAKGSIIKDRTVKAEDLREALKPIHEELRAKGVSDEDLPSNEYLISKLTELIDPKAVKKLADEYSKWVEQKP